MPIAFRPSINLDKAYKMATNMQEQGLKEAIKRPSDQAYLKSQKLQSLSSLESLPLEAAIKILKGKQPHLFHELAQLQAMKEQGKTVTENGVAISVLEGNVEANIRNLEERINKEREAPNPRSQHLENLDRLEKIKHWEFCTLEGSHGAWDLGGQEGVNRLIPNGVKIISRVNRDTGSHDWLLQVLTYFPCGNGFVAGEVRKDNGSQMPGYAAKTLLKLTPELVDHAIATNGRSLYDRPATVKEVEAATQSAKSYATAW